MKPKAVPTIYGLMAEFQETDVLVEAARRCYADGYRRMDGYSPMPIEGLAEAMGFERNGLPQVVFAGGLFGAIAGFALQWYSAVIDYPVNIGGRPLNSWPAFIPITFETTVLCASLAAVFGMIALNGLPKPYHPVFNVEGFELASRSHFFLCVMSDDPKFDVVATRAFLESLGPASVQEVRF
jgi:hypothetical protein